MAHMHWPSSVALMAYLAAVLVLGFVHAPWVLALTLILAMAAAGKMRWQLLRRSLSSVFTFNLCISLGCVVMALWHGVFDWLYLLRINLRVTLLVFLGFWCIRRVNLLQALAFAPSLARLTAVAAGQALVFRRLVQDFRLALISRSVGMRLPWIQRLRHGAALSAHLLDKSVARAEQTTRAMCARGCLDD